MRLDATDRPRALRALTVLAATQGLALLLSVAAAVRTLPDSGHNASLPGLQEVWVLVSVASLAGLVMLAECVVPPRPVQVAVVASAVSLVLVGSSMFLRFVSRDLVLLTEARWLLLPVCRVVELVATVIALVGLGGRAKTWLLPVSIAVVTFSVLLALVSFGSSPLYRLFETLRLSLMVLVALHFILQVLVEGGLLLLVLGARAAMEAPASAQAPS